MILSYRDKRTKEFAGGKFVRPFQGFDRQGWKRLDILNAAVSLTDLAGLPSNRLEALKGDRVGSGPFASTSNGASVLNGRPMPMARRMLKLSITTKRKEHG